MKRCQFVGWFNSLCLILLLVGLSGHSSPETRRKPERGKTIRSSTSRYLNYYSYGNSYMSTTTPDHGDLSGVLDHINNSDIQEAEEPQQEQHVVQQEVGDKISVYNQSLIDALEILKNSNTTTGGGSSGSGNNGTVGTTSTTEASNVTEDSENDTEIPSFSEWTKLQLEKSGKVLDRKTNNITRIDGKNFASPDCGAKVLSANPEAQNPSGFLSTSLDDYMLNRCGVSIYFTIELCEPMRIEKISMGNLELFSSSPKTFEVMLSDRYPSRDWTRFGPFESPESKNVHNFMMPSNTTFAKYLRIQIMSHWGSEHYCPLTILKVYGKSEYEALESENIQEEIIEENSISEEMLEMKPSPPSTQPPVIEQSQIQSPIPLAPEQDKPPQTVMNVIKGLVQKVLSGKTDLTEMKMNICISTTQCVPESLSKSIIEHHLSCDYTILKQILSWSSWCGWDYCHGLFSQYSIGSPQQIEGLFQKIYGVEILKAACHLHRPLKVCTLERSENLMNFSEPANQSRISEQPSSSDSIVNNSTPETPVENVLPSPPSTTSPAIPQDTEEVLPSVRESVIVRLSNRIKNLERNQSLSSGYLEELSRRFKKQSEETLGINEIFKKGLNSSSLKIKYIEDLISKLERNLMRSLNTLRDRISDLELQRGILFFFVLLQFIGFTIFIYRIKSSINKKMNNFEVQIAQLLVGRQYDTNFSSLTRKRNLPNGNINGGDLETSKPKKKKKRKNNGNGNGNNNQQQGFNFQPPATSHSNPNLSTSAPLTNLNYTKDKGIQNSKGLHSTNNNNPTESSDSIASSHLSSTASASREGSTVHQNHHINHIASNNMMNNVVSVNHNHNDSHSNSSGGKKKGKFRSLIQIFDHKKV